MEHTAKESLLMAAYQAVTTTRGARLEVKGWALLGVTSLGVAGVFAALLAISRIPGVQDVFPWPLDFFQKGLVIHVVFSFVVWFVAIMGLWFHLAACRLGVGLPRWAVLGRHGMALSWISFPLLFVPAFLAGGEASLNNYVPAIIDPIYYLGLAVLGLGVALPAIRLLANLPGRMGPLDGINLTAVASAVIYLLALVCFLFAYLALAGEDLSAAYNEDLFWGGGHILQFANTALMLGVWVLLIALALNRVPIGDRLLSAAVAVLVLGAVMGPLFYAFFPAFSMAQTTAFTDLQYALAPSPVIVAVVLLLALGPWERAKLRDPAVLGVLFSLGVFGLGGVLGFFVDGLDTRTPSHYHGMIGGVTVAYMALFYRFLTPVCAGVPTRNKTVIWQLSLYAAGQAFQCAGLFLAGGFGAPRKTAGAEQDLQSIGEYVGMTFNGIGGLTAVVGGAMFVWLAAIALLRRAES